MKPKCPHSIWHGKKACEERFRMKPLQVITPKVKPLERRFK